jgi:SNF2 family DNA or RNA helicase
MMMEQAAVGLLLDPGMGKTSTCLAAFSILKETGANKRMLIIAPLRVCYSVWPNEVIKWEEFNHLKVTILHGPDKEERLHDDSDIFLINPEGLKWFLAPGAGRPEIVSADILCVDESSKFKATNTQRFKLLRPWVPSFNRRWILTGTPIPNGILDIFGQIFILDQGATLGRYITHFRNKWFHQSGFGGYTWSPMPGAFEEITDRIRPLVLRLAAKDHLDMPDLRIGNQWDLYVDLPPKAMDIYRSVEDNFLSKLTSGAIVAANAAAAGTKCRQIANGAVYYTEEDEDGVPDITKREWELIHDEKLSALESLIEELGGAPLLIFYEYDHDRERIQDKFGFPCLTGTSPKAGDTLINQFNSGSIPALLAHPASAGHGLNLQDTCKYVCMFGLTWNLEHYIQAIGRVWRQGQQNTVTVYRILARKTLDETVAMVLEKKAVNQDTLLDDLANTNLTKELASRVSAG